MRADGVATTQVGRQIGLAQPFASPLGELANGYIVQTEPPADLTGAFALDLEVPQRGAPPRGQRAEGRRGERPVQVVYRYLVSAHHHIASVAGLEGEVVADGRVMRAVPTPGGRDVAHGHQKVGKQVALRAVLPAQGAKDPGKGFRDEVLGQMWIGNYPTRRAVGGRTVVSVELPEGRGVAVADPAEQILVGEVDGHVTRSESAAYWTCRSARCREHDGAALLQSCRRTFRSPRAVGRAVRSDDQRCVSPCVARAPAHRATLASKSGTG